MKAFYSFLSAILVGTAAALSQGDARVSVDFFHDNLETYGDWREIGNLGYCWQPRDVDRDWRPYSDGRWLYTDAGWTWDSDEPYSWAVFHYGRWARVDRVGWVWVPGTQWGPGWVSWRRSPSQVGWAPLSPEAEFDRSVGFDSRVDAEYDIGPTNYNFVEIRNFGAPRLRAVLIDPQDNITIFSQSENITRITYVNDVVYNDGPPYDAISRESAQPIPRLKLERQQGFGGGAGAARTGQMQNRVDGNSLRVVSIPFDARPATAPRKVAAKIEDAVVDRGWNNAGPPAEVAKLRARIRNGTAAPSGLPGSKPETTAQVPTASPAPNGKRPKEKATQSERLPTPIPAVARDATPRATPLNADASNPQHTPPANEEAVPPSHAKKGRNTGDETPHPAVGSSPDGVENGRSPNTGRSERAPNVPPPAVETPRQKIRPGQGDVPPKPEQPTARDTERGAPNVLESHPPAKKREPSEPAPPTANQPPPVKAKATDKGKDEKKEKPKPEGTPQ